MRLHMPVGTPRSVQHPPSPHRLGRAFASRETAASTPHDAAPSYALGQNHGAGVSRRALARWPQTLGARKQPASPRQQPPADSSPPAAPPTRVHKDASRFRSATSDALAARAGARITNQPPLRLDMMSRDTRSPPTAPRTEPSVTSPETFLDAVPDAAVRRGGTPAEPPVNLALSRRHTLLALREEKAREFQMTLLRLAERERERLKDEEFAGATRMNAPGQTERGVPGTTSRRSVSAAKMRSVSAGSHLRKGPDGSQGSNNVPLDLKQRARAGQAPPAQENFADIIPPKTTSFDNPPAGSTVTTPRGAPSTSLPVSPRGVRRKPSASRRTVRKAEKDTWNVAEMLFERDEPIVGWTTPEYPFGVEVAIAAEDAYARAADEAPPPRVIEVTTPTKTAVRRSKTAPRERREQDDATDEPTAYVFGGADLATFTAVYDALAASQGVEKEAPAQAADGSRPMSTAPARPRSPRPGGRTLSPCPATAKAPVRARQNTPPQSPTALTAHARDAWNSNTRDITSPGKDLRSALSVDLSKVASSGYGQRRGDSDAGRRTPTSSRRTASASARKSSLKQAGDRLAQAADAVRLGPTPPPVRPEDRQMIASVVASVNKLLATQRVWLAKRRTYVDERIALNSDEEDECSSTCSLSRSQSYPSDSGDSHRGEWGLPPPPPPQGEATDAPAATSSPRSHSTPSRTPSPEAPARQEQEEPHTQPQQPPTPPPQAQTAAPATTAPAARVPPRHQDPTASTALPRTAATRNVSAAPKKPILYTMEGGSAANITPVKQNAESTPPVVIRWVRR